MPTKREREDYRSGFQDGYDQGVRVGIAAEQSGLRQAGAIAEYRKDIRMGRGAELFEPSLTALETSPKRVTQKRKLSGWQKFVKQNSNKREFRYQGGGKKGMINFKKLGVAYRRKQRR